LVSAGLPTTAPRRAQPAGNNTTPGTLDTNHKQQDYFVGAATRVVLPMFQKSGKPFVLLYWSRDPDGTQHNQGDSLNRFVPGINGPTSKAGLRDADNNLKQILDYINSDPQLAANTDIFLTADHGFATISRHDVNAAGGATTSYAAKWVYRDNHGRQDVNTNYLPQGFLAIDLAHALGLPLYDPDTQITGPGGEKRFARVDPENTGQIPSARQHPEVGNGLIGGTGRIAPQTDAKVVVAANGGSDLVYLPERDPELAARIVKFLAGQDYVGGIFVNDDYGDLPGTLPTSAIRLVGSSPLPSPGIVVAFKTFSVDPANPLMTGVQITDSGLQQGQGMHGSFGRANTFNFMAAFGPDFKNRFVDEAPISNADINPTLARILSLSIPAKGKLKGRVLREALAGGPPSVAYQRKIEISKRSENGNVTILMYQQAGAQLYFDQACFKSAPVKKSERVCP
ncbi:MAG: alkaline phosphatase family protein, partial [Candidatus Acidiferrales bacterium]